MTHNNDECQFVVEKVLLLGHIVTAQGIIADPGKIKPIAAMPTPGDTADVKRSVGLAKYLGKSFTQCCGAHAATDRAPQSRNH